MIRESRLRPGLAFAGIVLAVVSYSVYRRDEVGRDEARRMLPAAVAAGTTTELGRLVEFSDDEGLATLAVARAALLRYLDPQAVAPSVAEVRTIEEICLRLLAGRPSFSAAAATLGRARLLRLSMEGDPRLWQERALWEEPLRHAAAAAPSSPEPRRFLAQGLLTVWFALSAEERKVAREAIREALNDPATLRDVGPAWFAQAAGPMEALDLFPDRSQAWDLATLLAAERADWRTLIETRRRGRAAARRELEAGLAEGERLLTAGRDDQARSALLQGFASAPADEALRPGVDRALQLLPPGGVELANTDRRREWLEWSLQRFLHGAPALSPGSLDRLAQSSRESAPARQALVAFAAGRVAAAEALQRRAAYLDDAWGPYLLARARQLAQRGRAPEATATYELVPAAWRGTPLDLEIGARLGHAPTDPSRQSPPLPAWSAVPGGSRLAFRTLSPTRSVRIAWSDLPPEGAVADVLADGAWRACVAVRPDQILTVPLTLEPGAHWLEVRPLGRRFRPAGAALSTEQGAQALVPFVESFSR